MRLIWCAIASCLASAAARAQNPGDVRFTLTIPSGRTAFLMGESIKVEFHFHSSAPGRYCIDVAPDQRVVRIPLFDKLIVEPKSNIADPLADIPAQIQSGGSSIGPT